MSLPNILVVSIDGFGVAAAGAYGQTSLPTPGWDALATDAITFDFVEASGASFDQAFVSIEWPGSPERPEVADALRYFSERGGSLRFGGDSNDAPSSFSVAFDAGSPFALEAAAAPVQNEDQTHALRWLARAERTIEEFADEDPDQPHLLWLHHDGAYAAWDAPAEWREALRDEGDPAAYSGVEPPALDARGEASDPDRFLPYVFAWAGQASAWDRLAEGLHLLWKRIDAKRPTTMIVFGLRGYPLGEHGVVGDGDFIAYRPLLQEERLHVPFFVLPPGGAFPGKRSFRVRRRDQLLAELIGNSFSDEGFDLATSTEFDLPSAVLVQEKESVSVRTAAWRFVRDQAGARLYLKPDDKWEANDVASRRRETVEAFENWLEERQRDSSVPLPDEATEM